MRWNRNERKKINNNKNNSSRPVERTEWRARVCVSNYNIIIGKDIDILVNNLIGDASHGPFMHHFSSNLVLESIRTETSEHVRARMDLVRCGRTQTVLGFMDFRSDSWPRLVHARCSHFSVPLLLLLLLLHCYLSPTFHNCTLSHPFAAYTFSHIWSRPSSCGRFCCCSVCVTHSHGRCCSVNFAYYKIHKGHGCWYFGSGSGKYIRELVVLMVFRLWTERKRNVKKKQIENERDSMAMMVKPR